MKNKYKIGDKVKFVNCDNRTIPSYHYENNSNIPDEYIKHGSIVFKINEGEIIHIYDKYYIVRYIDEYNKQVQLGFKEKDIELLNKEETSLVGRYIKALVDNAQNSKIIKDKYYLIKKHIDTAITIDNGYQLDTQYQNKYYELMPIGFNIPDEQEVTSKTIDFSILDLDEWLVETKKLNLSLDKLKNHISYSITCNWDKVYKKLKGGICSEKSQILYDEWNNKLQFEVGKWYKGKISSNTDNIYIKFKKIKEGDGYNYIYYSEKIKDGIYSIREDYWASNVLEKYALNNPVDLSEIQEFLPDGHVDKINTKKHTFTNVRGFTFEEDKIYFYIGYLVRFKKELEKVNNYINLAVKSYIINERFNFNDNDTNLRLATPDESEWFEMCEKVGKYVDKPIKQEVMVEINEFKKGDYIVVISGRGDSSVNVKNDFIYKQKNNSKHLITEKSSANIVYDATDVLFNNSKDKWRYATNEEIAEYDKICKPYDVNTLIKKTNQKHVKDLKYPDVVEINSHEEYNAIATINGYDMPYNKSDKAYLIDKDGKIGCGKASNMKCYSSKEFDYNHYKFSDLIFPEVSAKHCEVTSNTTTIDIPEYVECIKSYFYEIEYIKGNIYQIFNNSIGHERGTGIVSINGEQRFIPSTKEAYDKQQALLNGGIFAVEYEKAPIDLSNTKIWIGDNPELSKLVQEKAFELGFRWLGGSNEINNTDKEALYFYDDRDITHSSSGKAYFKDKEKFKEIYPSDLGIRITQVNILGIEKEVFYKELPNNNNNQINKLQRVKPKLIEIKKLN